MQLTQNTYFGEGNRYYLQKLLGRGGFSKVWLAKDAITDLELALKVYVPGTGMDEDGLQTFSKELARVYHLNHTNLLRPQHVDSWQGMPYLLMAYCPQGSLVKRIGGMPETEIRKVLHDVASGLAYLHAHDVIHQDIKPDNILLDDTGNYVITDFGISARARSTLRKSVAASAAHSGGTIAYMGPERFGKEPAPIKASDVWSLGAMLYELMTGDTPFGEHGGLIQKSGAEIPTIQGNYSDELKQMVEQMLALNPWDRPTAENLAAGYAVPSSSSIPTAPTRTRPTEARPTTSSAQPASASSRPTMPAAAASTIPMANTKDLPRNYQGTIKEEPAPSAPIKFPMYANIALGIMMAVYAVGCFLYVQKADLSYKYCLYYDDYWQVTPPLRGDFEISITFVIGTIVAIMLLLFVWSVKKKKLLYAYISFVVIDFIVALIIGAFTDVLSYWGPFVPSMGMPLVILAIFFVKIKGKSVYSLLR